MKFELAYVMRAMSSNPESSEEVEIPEKVDFIVKLRIAQIFLFFIVLLKEKKQKKTLVTFLSVNVGFVWGFN